MCAHNTHFSFTPSTLGVNVLEHFVATFELHDP